MSLLGAAALTAGLLVLKHQRREELETGVRITTRTKRIPAGERLPRIADLERLRELGL